MLPPSILRRVLIWSVAMTALSGLAVWKETGPFSTWADVPSALEAALSVAFGLLLAFRVNRAFDRWWEARTLWGTLVNASRNLAIKASSLVNGRDESVDRMRRLIVAFPYVLKQHLREGVDVDQLAERVGERIEAVHTPSAIVSRIYAILESWSEQGRIRDEEFRMIDLEAKVLLEVCGGCERIRNTPIANSYRVILKHAVFVYLLSLPWGIVNDFGWWTIPIELVVTYFVIGAEGIADHIEHPFVNDGDGLQLDRICHAIEDSVDEVFATADGLALAPRADEAGMS